VKTKMRTYEGHLKQLEGRLRQLRGQAGDASGRARVQLAQAERRARQAIDFTLEQLNRAMVRLEPQVNRALHQTKALGAGLRAGLRAGAAKYRETRRH
jgi:hypothetical protein